MNNLVKICGIKTPEFVDICAAAGADFIGFVSIKKSARYIDIATIGKLIEHAQPTKMERVVLTMNPTYDEMWEINKLGADYIQLHGDETPLFCQDIKATSNLKIMKAISVETADDIEAARQFENIVNILLFDTKPIAGDELPGGNGQPFNWNLLHDQKFNCQTMLAGGLNASNVQQAMQQSGIDNIDVSSAVEISRGNKDKALIEQFIQSAKGKM
ncbi:MAG: phosphoribosylanthranilate isomerase [Alphaproteobacteria bacterium]|nr:phosphoribosylanthranilate isomerase [Alphaproteobacteria bacterium]